MLLAFLLMALSTPSWAEETQALRIIDGDTLELNGVKYRLHGIDAPEKKQTCKIHGVEWSCGQASTNWLNEFVDGKTVTCAERGKGKYGRSIAICYSDGRSINAALVRSGWALAAPKYAHTYLRYQYEAENKKLGIWESDFQNPHDYRRR